MTGFTVIGGINMTGILTSRCGAVMTITTAADYLPVVNLSGRCPVGVNVAAFATVSGIYMSRVFTSGSTAIMAAGTVVGNSRMIKSCFGPAKLRPMAILTGISTGNMVCRFPFGN